MTIKILQGYVDEIHDLIKAHDTEVDGDKKTVIFQIMCNRAKEYKVQR